VISRRHMIASAGAGLAISACAPMRGPSAAAPGMETIGTIQSLDPALATLIDPATPIEVVAKGFDWSEGPAWDSKRKRLLFSDVPQNKIHSWSRSEGLKTFLEPSGATYGKAHADPKPGTNGLWYQGGDTLLMCNQSGRSIDRLNLATGAREIVVDADNGRPLNKVNDIAARRDGRIFFTDPAFGLDGSSPRATKFLPYSAAYTYGPNGLSIIDSTLEAPNGIALSPDEKTVYVAQSGEAAPRIMRYDVDADGKVKSSALFFDVKSHPVDGMIGRADGMAIDRKGNVFLGAVDAGLFIISPQGKLLGRITAGRKISNCIFGEDGSVLFLTADDMILRVQTRTRADLR